MNWPWCIRVKLSVRGRRPRWWVLVVKSSSVETAYTLAEKYGGNVTIYDSCWWANTDYWLFEHFIIWCIKEPEIGELQKRWISGLNRQKDHPASPCSTSSRTTSSRSSLLSTTLMKTSMVFVLALHKVHVLGKMKRVEQLFGSRKKAIRSPAVNTWRLKAPQDIEPVWRRHRVWDMRRSK